MWRRPAQCHEPAFTIVCHTARQRGVIVWGTVFYDSRTSLVFLRRNLTTGRYVDFILRPVLLQFLSKHPRLILQQYNARPHTARLSMDYLLACDTVPWASRSPHFSPIDHIWGLMASPTTISKCRRISAPIGAIWHDIPQTSIRPLSASMPHRITACIRARGGATPY